MATARVNPLLYAGMAEDVIFCPGDALGLAGYDADARAHLKIFQADTAFAFGHAHLFSRHKRRYETLFYWLRGSVGNAGASQRVGKVGPGKYWGVGSAPGSHFQMR